MAVSRPSAISGPAPGPAPGGRGQLTGFAARAAAADTQTPGNVSIARRSRSKGNPRASNSESPKAQNLDRRILLRLQPDSQFFTKHAYQIRLALAHATSLPADDFQDIKPTNTGWSLTTRTNASEATLLETQAQWGPKVDLIIAEKNIQWHTYLVKEVPRVLRDWEGQPLDFEQTISDEIKRQTDQSPISWHVSKADEATGTPIVTLVVSFSEPVASRFQLLGTSAFSFKLTRAPKISQCQSCWNYHAPTRCIAPEICKNCGQHTSSDHNASACDRITQCVNCHGPHLPDDQNCFAKPKKRDDGLHKLSRTQRTHAKLLGAQAFKRSHPELAPELNSMMPESSAPSSPTPLPRDQEGDTTMDSTSPTAPSQLTKPKSKGGPMATTRVTITLPNPPPANPTGIKSTHLRTLTSSALARTVELPSPTRDSSENETNSPLLRGRPTSILTRPRASRTAHIRKPRLMKQATRSPRSSPPLQERSPAKRTKTTTA